MDPVLAALARRFRFNERLLDAETAGFEPADWARRPSEAGGNTPHWILGHVAQARRMAVRRVTNGAPGSPPREPWEELVGMNSKPSGTAGYPAVEALFADFRASGARIEELLPAIEPELAGAEWGGRAMPDGSRSVADVLHFLHFHETYHLGQLGLFRRLLGKPGFV